MEKTEHCRKSPGKAVTHSGLEVIKKGERVRSFEESRIENKSEDPDMSTEVEKQ